MYVSYVRCTLYVHCRLPGPGASPTAAAEGGDGKRKREKKEKATTIILTEQKKREEDSEGFTCRTRGKGAGVEMPMPRARTHEEETRLGPSSNPMARDSLPCGWVGNCLGTQLDPRAPLGLMDPLGQHDYHCRSWSGASYSSEGSAPPPTERGVCRPPSRRR